MVCSPYRISLLGLVFVSSIGRWSYSLDRLAQSDKKCHPTAANEPPSEGSLAKVLGEKLVCSLHHFFQVGRQALCLCKSVAGLGFPATFLQGSGQQKVA